MAAAVGEESPSGISEPSAPSGPSGPSQRASEWSNVESEVVKVGGWNGLSGVSKLLRMIRRAGIAGETCVHSGSYSPSLGIATRCSPKKMEPPLNPLKLSWGASPPGVIFDNRGFHGGIIYEWLSFYCHV